MERTIFPIPRPNRIKQKETKKIFQVLLEPSKGPGDCHTAAARVIDQASVPVLALDDSGERAGGETEQNNGGRVAKQSQGYIRQDPLPNEALSLHLCIPTFPNQSFRNGERKLWDWNQKQPRP